MATGPDLKSIALARLKTAEILITAADWHGAAYMLPYALECSLKAVICKTLHLTAYPDNEKSESIRSFFTTHLLIQLLVVSGLQDIFGPTGPQQPYQYWSDFTIEYAGNWPQMRYDLKRMQQFDEGKVKKLHFMLTDPEHGIVTMIEKNARW